MGSGPPSISRSGSGFAGFPVPRRRCVPDCAGATGDPLTSRSPVPPVRALAMPELDPGIAAFLDRNRPETPCMVLSLDIVAARYRALQDVLPDATIYYAVKANPEDPAISILGEL